MEQSFIVQESYIDISREAANDWIYVNWKGFQTVKSVKAGCESILQAMSQEKLHKVLNDNTHVQGIWSGAAEWVGAEWFPRMQLAGLQKFAWVYSPSVFSQLSTDKALNHTKEGFVRTFYAVEDAAAWLT